MPLKVITADGTTHSIHSPNDFEKVFCVKYLSGLQYIDVKVQKKIEKRSLKVAAKGWISSHQKWLGHYYAQELSGKVSLDLTIAWIDDRIGYGVWTNREIPSQTCIGEYAGILRKRYFFRRWSNLYCFDYNIGSGLGSGFVIDAQDCGNHTRFINHSDKPNLETISVYCNGVFNVIIYAKEKISSGEQICYDYGSEYWKKRSQPRLL